MKLFPSLYDCLLPVCRQLDYSLSRVLFSLPLSSYIRLCFTYAEVEPLLRALFDGTEMTPLPPSFPCVTLNTFPFFPLFLE